MRKRKKFGPRRIHSKLCARIRMSRMQFSYQCKFTMEKILVRVTLKDFYVTACSVNTCHQQLLGQPIPSRALRGGARARHDFDGASRTKRTTSCQAFRRGARAREPACGPRKRRCPFGQLRICRELACAHFHPPPGSSCGGCCSAGNALTC